jgi:hypothetical protein
MNRTVKDRATLLTLWYAHVARGGTRKAFCATHNIQRNYLKSILAEAGLPTAQNAWQAENALQRLREDECSVLRARLRRAASNEARLKVSLDALRAQVSEMGASPRA